MGVSLQMRPMNNRRSHERKDMKKDRAFLPVPPLIRRRNLGSGQMSLGFLALRAPHQQLAHRALWVGCEENTCEASM
jgi:hypothetical protein